MPIFILLLNLLGKTSSLPVSFYHHKYRCSKVLHLRPYFALCFYCDVDFDIIGKLEEFKEDVAYISTKLNLTEQLGVLNNVENDTLGKEDNARRERRNYYMSQLSAQMVDDLYQLYKLDFEMFGYDQSF